jgi:DNA-directed RNA polymerase specialized sigma24 family protein
LGGWAFPPFDASVQSEVRAQAERKTVVIDRGARRQEEDQAVGRGGDRLERVAVEVAALAEGLALLDERDRLGGVDDVRQAEGERCVNESMLTTGTAVMRPCSCVGSSPRMTSMTAAIDRYSQPCTPPIRLRCGPSWAPVRSNAGTATALSVIVMRTRRIQYGRCVFRPLGEPELVRLDDDALIAYVRAARLHGDASARVALAVLVYGHWHNVARRVALKVPPAAVEDVTSEVLMSALQSAFDGASEGEFHVWLQTITARRIADFHRRPRPATVGLDEVSLTAPEQGALAVTDAVERVLARLSEEHRRVVELVVFAGLAASEVDGVSAANVHQITSRFRRALREELQ